MLPPRLAGEPLIGNMREFRRDPVACIRRGYRALGRIFSLRLGPKTVVVMIGPELHRLFYCETDKSLTTPEVYRFLTPMFGQVLGACPFHEYREHRRAIAPFFAQRLGSSHLQIMADETERLTRSLGEHGEFELWDTAEHLALTIAGKAVLGADTWARSGGAYDALFRDIARGMDYILPPTLPLPRFLRRNRARRLLSAAIGPLIEARRRGDDHPDDLLQSLATATFADGRPLSIEVAIGLALIMIHGAYETVAAQACWCLVDLVGRPALQKEIRIEVGGAGLFDNGTIAVGRVERLRQLKSAIHESMRMHPTATVVCRHAASPLPVDGYTIPRGALVMICPGVAHRLPDIFPQPDTFLAGRFLDGAPEPDQFATFGGGLHRCMGSDFAIAEIMLLIAALLQRYELRLTPPTPGANYDMSVTRPSPPCAVSYRLRQQSTRQEPTPFAAIP